MIKKNKVQILLSSIVIVLPVFLGLLLWKELPETMVSHWSVRGEADGWSSRVWMIVGMPFLLLALHWICLFFTSLDSRNQEQNPKVSGMILWIIPVLSWIVCGTVYAAAWEREIRSDRMIQVLLGLMLLMLGNYMPKCKQNYTIGVRVPWTLKSEKNWLHTHRFTGRVWFLGGLLIFAEIVLPIQETAGGYLFIGILLLMALLPMAYSYVFYRKERRAGAVGREEGECTQEGKAQAEAPGEMPKEISKEAQEEIQEKLQKKSGQRMKNLSLCIAIFGVVLALLVCLKGSYSLKLEEDRLWIDAVFWEDAAVRYGEIDSLEYREEDRPGSRTFGYGTPALLMGEFRNEEFGNYTRYSYTSCKSCIIVTVEDQVLVVNEKDPEATKALYQELMSRSGIME